jgi:hypothetical protein
MDKKAIWPREGKLKKGLIILAIVIVGALLITLLEEKMDVKFTKRIPYVIAFACVGIWFYNPAKKSNE